MPDNTIREPLAAGYHPLLSANSLFHPHCRLFRRRRYPYAHHERHIFVERLMDAKETLLSNLLPGARMAIAYAEKLLVGIPEELAALRPVVNGTRIDTNHPVFIFGHLSIYPALLAELTGLPKDGVEVPEQYPELFQIGSPCHDDPSGEIYPRLSEVSGRFLSGTRAILERLPSLDMQALNKELESPARRERFGTVGAFTLYILLAHPQAHLGQVSVWRRCMGLSAA